MKFTKSKKIILSLLLITVIFPYTTAYPLSNKNKILLIGLDAATWKAMTPLINQGNLPNIKKLMDNGYWGILESPDPSYSDSIWTSIATGKTPEEHGITNRLMKDPDTAELVPPTSNLRKVKAIWNILSENKNKVGVVGYLVTWPVEEINGVMISDRAKLDTHYLSKDYSYPPFANICNESKFQEIINVKDDVILKIFSGITEGEKEDNYFIFDNVYRTVGVDAIKDTLMFNYANYLLQNQTFNFFTVYLKGIDAVSHYFWKYLFPEGFDITQKNIEKYKNVITDYYIYCDQIIGNLIDKVDKDTIVIIISDHGFDTLRNNEYFFAKLNKFLQTSGLAEIKKGLKKIMVREQLTNMWVREKNINIKIDGLFTKEEFGNIRDEIKEIFNKIEVTETDKHIFKIGRDTEYGFVIEVDMDYINKHPNHHILVNNQEYIISEFLIEDPHSGRHDAFGIIIISGKNIRPNKLTDIATVYDITPTILYLMGLPVGKDMKGKVLVEAIDTKYLKKYPIKYIETYETNKQEKPQKPIRSPIDEEKIKERMRSLGYIN